MFKKYLFISLFLLSNQITFLTAERIAQPAEQADLSFFRLNKADRNKVIEGLSEEAKINFYFEQLSRLASVVPEQLLRTIHDFEITDIFENCFSQEQRDFLVLAYLDSTFYNTKFENIDWEDTDALDYLSPEARKNFCKKLIAFYKEAGKLHKVDPEGLSDLWTGVIETETIEEQARLNKEFLDELLLSEKYPLHEFDFLLLEALLKELSEEVRSSFCAEQLNRDFDTGLWKLVYENANLWPLYAGLTPAAKESLSKKVLQFFSENRIYDLYPALMTLYCSGLSDTEAREFRVESLNNHFFAPKTRHLLEPDQVFSLISQLPREEALTSYRRAVTLYKAKGEDEKIVKSTELDKILPLLPEDEQEALAQEVLNFMINTEGLNFYSVYTRFKPLILALPKEVKQNYLKFELFTELPTPTSIHIQKFLKKDFDTTTDNRFTLFTNCYLETVVTKPEIREMCIELNEYSFEEQEKGNLTFFHGQAWYWNLYETIFRKLWEQKYNRQVPEDFIFFRYKESFLTDEHAAKIQREGVQHYHADRFNILFANIALFANQRGSNTPSYVAENLDVSTGNGRNLQDFAIVFKEFGLENEIKLLMEQEPELFKQLEELHNKASVYGQFVAISMPKETVREVAYPTCSGGPIQAYNGTTDVVDIAENFAEIPFDSEFALVLGSKLCNPDKAAAAGVKIKTLNAADSDVLKLRDKLIDEVIHKAKALKS